jgi:hypothetical protein
LLWPSVPSDLGELAKLVPLGLACLATLGHLAYHNNGEQIDHVLHGHLSDAIKGRTGEKRSPMTLHIVTIAGAIATVGVLGLWAAVRP